MARFEVFVNSFAGFFSEIEELVDVVELTRDSDRYRIEIFVRVDRGHDGKRPFSARCYVQRKGQWVHVHALNETAATWQGAVQRILGSIAIEATNAHQARPTTG
jgi:hypothetical protein